MPNEEYQNGSALFNVRNRNNRMKRTCDDFSYTSQNIDYVNAEHSDVINNKPQSIIIKNTSNFGNTVSGKSIEHPSTLTTSIEYINMSNTDINISNRFGYVYRLKPGTQYSSLNRLSKDERDLVLSYGSGLYIVVRQLSNLESIVPTVGLLDSIENNYKENTVEPNDIFFGIKENKRLFGKLLDNRKELNNKASNVINAATGAYPTNIYMANSEMVTMFYYPEDVLCRNRIIYDKELDIVISPNVINYSKVLHPSFSLEDSELHKAIKEELDKQERIESIKFITKKKEGRIYRKIGDKIQAIKGEQPIADEKPGLYIYTSYLNDDDEIDTHRIFIPYNDKITLQEHGYFITADEARTFNSEIEIRRLKQQEVILNNQFKEQEREHELKVRELNEKINQKERELKELKLKLDHIEILSSHENSREEREFKQEERTFKREDRETERTYKERDRILDLEERIIEERTKRIKAEEATKAAESNNSSRNIGAFAGIIAGVATITSALTKIFIDHSAKKEKTETFIRYASTLSDVLKSTCNFSAITTTLSKVALPLGIAALVVGAGYLIYKGVKEYKNSYTIELI